MCSQRISRINTMNCRVSTPWWIAACTLSMFFARSSNVLGAANHSATGDRWKKLQTQAGALSVDRPSQQRFRIRQTAHFSIAYDTSELAVVPVCDTIEEVFESVLRFCKWSGIEPKFPPARLPILFFDRLEDFTEYGRSVDVESATIAGFYHHETNIAAFCHARESPAIKPIVVEIERMAGEMRRAEETGIAGKKKQGDMEDQLKRLRRLREELSERFNRIVIRHETAHQVLYNLGVHIRRKANPLWLTEGLACQFEVEQNDPSGALTQSNFLRLVDMHEALGARSPNVDNPYDQYTSAIHSGRLISTSDLITEIGEDWQDPLALRFYYAQASSLVDYLHRRHPNQFRSYLRHLLQSRSIPSETNQSQLDVFQKFFGEPSEQFDRAWMSDLVRAVPTKR